MYKFIDEVINNKKELYEQIKLQNELGFDGFYKNKMLEEIPYFQKMDRKCSSQIITPQQSIFSLVAESHEKICNMVLEAVYKRNFQRTKNSIRLNNIENNMKLGNIYINTYDSDTVLKKSFLDNIFNKPWNVVSIFVPQYINEFQLDELRKTINTVKKYDKIFKNNNIRIIHFLNDKMNEQKSYIQDDITRFLNKSCGEILKYVKEVQIDPDEEIIVNTCKNPENNRANFLSSIKQEADLAINGNDHFNNTQNIEIVK